MSLAHCLSLSPGLLEYDQAWVGSHLGQSQLSLVVEQNFSSSWMMRLKADDEPMLLLKSSQTVNGETQNDSCRLVVIDQYGYCLKKMMRYASG